MGYGTFDQSGSVRTLEKNSAFSAEKDNYSLARNSRVKGCSYFVDNFQRRHTFLWTQQQIRLRSIFRNKDWRRVYAMHRIDSSLGATDNTGPSQEIWFFSAKIWILQLWPLPTHFTSKRIFILFLFAERNYTSCWLSQLRWWCNFCFNIKKISQELLLFC